MLTLSATTFSMKIEEIRGINQNCYEIALSNLTFVGIVVCKKLFWLYREFKSKLNGEIIAVLIILSRIFQTISLVMPTYVEKLIVLFCLCSSINRF